MADEYKALTVVNLPFIEERYMPGDVIPHERFEAMAEAAAGSILATQDENATPVWTADEQVEELMKWGSISDDLDAEIHPQNTIPDPNKPTLAAMVAQAQAMVDELESRGEEVPARLRAFSEISDRQVSSVDAGIGGGENAG